MAELDSYIIFGIVSLIFLIGSAELVLKKLISVVVVYKQLKAAVQGDELTEKPTGDRARLVAQRRNDHK